MKLGGVLKRIRGIHRGPSRTSDAETLHQLNMKLGRLWSEHLLEQEIRRDKAKGKMMTIFDSLGGQRYGAILCDPPWTFRVYSDKGKTRSAEQHYPCMTRDELRALPVAERWAAPDCTLFLWTTDPHLPEALALVRAWGFEYKTVAFHWMKLNKSVARNHHWSEFDFFAGLGYWTRANPEMCLLATRGHPKRIAKDVRRLIVAPRREHSRKPDEIYGLIERLVGGPYVELFARQSREGWDSWGLETKKFARS